MAKTQLEYKCPEQSCGKKVETIGEFNDSGRKFLILSCGHISAIDLVKPVGLYENFISSEGDVPYKFQIEGMQFIQDSGGKCLIADEMGLGKTIQGLGFLFFNPTARPALIIVKKKTITQWFKEIYRWCDKSLAQMIMQGHAILPGLQYYIISMDLLRAYPLERLEKVGIKSIVIDECQHFVNANTKRTQFLRDLIVSLQVKNVIALSGTPFKNRLSEYFTILNILMPHYFQNKEEFMRSEIAYYYDGRGKLRESGLKNPKRFKEITKHYILRRERQDVEDQIPYIGIKRNLQYVDLEGKFLEAYNNAAEEFAELFEKIEYQKSAAKENSELLAILQRMRHIVGLSKIPDTVDFVTDFLLSTERKIVIFLHHQDVAEHLIRELNRWLRMEAYKECLQIRGSMDGRDLGALQDKWNTDPSYRVLVASTLAAGEGLNLQKMCNECILMERQWNAANEEQAEARLRRIGGSGEKIGNVISTYMTAGGTIDEMLAEIDERKRAVVKSGMMSKEQIAWTESEMIRQLGEMIIKKRKGQKWTLM